MSVSDGANKSVTNVVGIGASAGGLEAIQALVDCLPNSLEGVAIVITQHLSPDYKSMLVELLGRKTEIPVEHITNGMAVEPNCLYIAPPSDDVYVRDGVFFLKPPLSVGAHPSADILLTSLAESYGAKAGGVILSGTGKDGTKGLTAIRSVGGTTIAQDTATAKYEGMPQAAISAGVVDHVLGPGKIGSNLLDLLKSGSSDGASAEKNLIIDETPTVSQIFQLLEHRIGTDFTEYKSSTLGRRLQKRIQERHFKTEDEYLEYIKKHPEELDRLFEAMLIGVTSFFRDPESFKELKKVISNIIDSKNKNDVIRVWIPGCATGEEAYTVAMMLCEVLESSGKSISLQIFATDIDMKALQKARLGYYRTETVSKVPDEYLKKYFKKLNSTTYEVKKEVRRLVLFSRHDVTANPPFLRLDLITCRNVLIYFNNELQKKVIPLFYYALNPKGYMMLGKSENIGKFQNLFSVTSSNYKIFQRKKTDNRFTLPQLRPVKSPEVSYSSPLQQDLTIADMVKETLFSNYDYPFVVVDDRLDIVEINGDISTFIQFKQGSATLNLSKLVISELQIELKSVVGKSIGNMQLTRGNIRKIGRGKDVKFVRVICKPLLYSQPNNPYYLVIFENLELDSKMLRFTAVETGKGENPEVIELENELDATKEHLNSLLEELETSNEELQALNEEMQASNEELQASNEELETSNEELQATNEELENAYSEIKEASSQIALQKDELARSADNLSTLLNNTLASFILIDKDYKVIAANKTAQKAYRQLFNTRLKENSSFMKALPENLFPAFHKSFIKALHGKQVVEEVVMEDLEGNKHYYDINYTPVKKTPKEKEARHIVVSFVDVTSRKQAELELAKSNKALSDEKKFMSTLTETLPSIVWTTDTKGKFTYVNRQFEQYTGKKFAEIEGKGLEFFVQSEDWDGTSHSWRESLLGGQPFAIEHRIVKKDGTYRWFLTVVDAVRDEEGKVRMWVGSSTEVEDLKAQQEMERSVARLQEEHRELVRLNKVKDEFIGIASHQLRSPATAVKQYLELIIMGFAGKVPPELLKYLNIAHVSNERQLTVINELLKTAQLDAQDYKVNISKHNLSKFIEEIVSEMEPMMILKSQKLKIKCDESLTAKFDYEELKLAIVNLIENASKYSHKGEQINISVKQSDHHVSIIIKDRGVGIDSEHQLRIFDKFSRIDNELSDTVQGSGLGLYLVKRIVELHKGKLRVKSKIKEGSSFTVELPV